MKKTILIVTLQGFADWEYSYVSNFILTLGKGEFDIKTVSLTKEHIKSLCGLTVLPDYDIETAPSDFEGLLLIGANTWRDEESMQVQSLVAKALEKGKVLGAICDASVFLGKMGILNEVKHTSNYIDDLKAYCGEAYTNEENYIMEQAVCDENIITANGTAALEFAKEVSIALNIAPQVVIDKWYDFYKLGCYKASYPDM